MNYDLNMLLFSVDGWSEVSELQSLCPHCSEQLQTLFYLFCFQTINKSSDKIRVRDLQIVTR